MIIPQKTEDWGKERKRNMLSTFYAVNRHDFVLCVNVETQVYSWKQDISWSTILMTSAERAWRARRIRNPRYLDDTLTYRKMWINLRSQSQDSGSDDSEGSVLWGM